MKIDIAQEVNQKAPRTLIEKKAPSEDDLRRALEAIEDDEPPLLNELSQTSEMPRRATISMDAISVNNPATVEERIVRAPSDIGKTQARPVEGRPVSHLVAAFAGGIVLAASVGGLIWLSSTTILPDGEVAETPTKPSAVSIPAGRFFQGLSNDYRLIFADICPKIAEDPKTECKEEIALAGEYPMKEMTLPAFSIDAWEVSNQEWNQCVKQGACKTVQWGDCANWSIRGLVPFLEIPQEFRGAERPVVCVSREEAESYCKHVGGHLPTQQEWEKAARGEDAFLFPWGTNWTTESSNWGERDMTRLIVAGQLDGFTATSPVWSFDEGKSPYGVLNMAGNAAEWVSSGDESLGATARGGSWRSDPLEVRTTVRFPLKKGNRRTDVGFRCAYDK